MGMMQVKGEFSGRTYDVNFAGEEPTPQEIANATGKIQALERQFETEFESVYGDQVIDDGTGFGRGFESGLTQLKSSLGTAVRRAGEGSESDFIAGIGTGLEDSARRTQLSRAGTATPFRTFDEAREGGVGDTLSYIGEIAGQSGPQTLAGVGAAGLATLAVPAAPITAALTASAAVLFPLFYGSNIQSQESEIAAGNLSGIDNTKALQAAALQSTLNSIADKLLIGPLFNPAKKIFTRVVQGAGQGTLSEVPTEISQQVLERWQAGKPLDNPEAIAEYREVGIAAGILGSGIGGTTSVFKGPSLDKGTDTKLKPPVDDASSDVGSDVDSVKLPSPKKPTGIGTYSAAGLKDFEATQTPLGGLAGLTGRLPPAVENAADRVSASDVDGDNVDAFIAGLGGSQTLQDTPTEVGDRYGGSTLGGNQTLQQFKSTEPTVKSKVDDAALLEDARRLVTERKVASVSGLQRDLKISGARAAKLISLLAAETNPIVGPADKKGRRKYIPMTVESTPNAVPNNITPTTKLDGSTGVEPKSKAETVVDTRTRVMEVLQNARKQQVAKEPQLVSPTGAQSLVDAGLLAPEDLLVATTTYAKVVDLLKLEPSGIDALLATKGKVKPEAKPVTEPEQGAQLPDRTENLSVESGQAKIDANKGRRAAEGVSLESQTLAARKEAEFADKLRRNKEQFEAEAAKGGKANPELLKALQDQSAALNTALNAQKANPYEGGDYGIYPESVASEPESDVGDDPKEPLVAAKVTVAPSKEQPAPPVTRDESGAFIGDAVDQAIPDAAVTGSPLVQSYDNSLNLRAGKEGKPFLASDPISSATTPVRMSSERIALIAGGGLDPEIARRAVTGDISDPELLAELDAAATKTLSDMFEGRNRAVGAAAQAIEKRQGTLGNPDLFPDITSFEDKLNIIELLNMTNDQVKAIPDTEERFRVQGARYYFIRFRRPAEAISEIMATRNEAINFMKMNDVMSSKKEPALDQGKLDEAAETERVNLTTSAFNVGYQADDPLTPTKIEEDRLFYTPLNTQNAKRASQWMRRNMSRAAKRKLLEDYKNGKLLKASMITGEKLVSYDVTIIDDESSALFGQVVITSTYDDADTGGVAEAMGKRARSMQMGQFLSAGRAMVAAGKEQTKAERIRSGLPNYVNPKQADLDKLEQELDAVDATNAAIRLNPKEAKALRSVFNLRGTEERDANRAKDVLARKLFKTITAISPLTRGSVDTSQGGVQDINPADAALAELELVAEEDGVVSERQIDDAMFAELNRQLEAGKLKKVGGVVGKRAAKLIETADNLENDPRDVTGEGGKKYADAYLKFAGKPTPYALAAAKTNGIEVTDSDTNFTIVEKLRDLEADFNPEDIKAVRDRIEAEVAEQAAKQAQYAKDVGDPTDAFNADVEGVYGDSIIDEVSELAGDVLFGDADNTLNLVADAVSVLADPLRPSIQNQLANNDLQGALMSMALTSPSKTVSKAAVRLIRYVGNTDLKLVSGTLTDPRGRAASGRFDPSTNTISIDRDTGMNSHTVLHEVFHAASAANIANMKLPEARQLRTIYEAVKKQLPPSYATSSLDEFVAEAFSNPDFQVLLAGIPMSDLKIANTSMTNAWVNFKTAIRRMYNRFMGRPQDSVFGQADLLLDKILAPQLSNRAAPAMYLAASNPNTAGKLLTNAMGAVKPSTKEEIQAKFTKVKNSGALSSGKSFLYGISPLNILADTLKRDYGNDAGVRLNRMVNKVSSKLRDKTVKLDYIVNQIKGFKKSAGMEKYKLLQELVPTSTLNQVDPSVKRNIYTSYGVVTTNPVSLEEGTRTNHGPR